MTQPPDGLPRYRVLTGPDDAAFCHRVSEVMALGYQLYQGPAVTFNATQVIVAQALVWPGPTEQESRFAAEQMDEFSRRMGH
jgi:hypothetical protein